MISSLPTGSTSALVSLFFCMRALALTLYLAAMRPRISPALTVWTRPGALTRSFLPGFEPVVFQRVPLPQIRCADLVLGGNAGEGLAGLHRDHAVGIRRVGRNGRLRLRRGRRRALRPGRAAGGADGQALPGADILRGTQPVPGYEVLFGDRVQGADIAEGLAGLENDIAGVGLRGRCPRLWRGVRLLRLGLRGIAQALLHNGRRALQGFALRVFPVRVRGHGRGSIASARAGVQGATRRQQQYGQRFAHGA